MRALLFRCPPIPFDMRLSVATKWMLPLRISGRNGSREILWNILEKWSGCQLGTEREAGWVGLGGGGVSPRPGLKGSPPGRVAESRVGGGAAGRSRFAENAAGSRLPRRPGRVRCERRPG